MENIPSNPNNHSDSRAPQFNQDCSIVTASVPVPVPVPVPVSGSVTPDDSRVIGNKRHRDSESNPTRDMAGTADAKLRKTVKPGQLEYVNQMGPQDSTAQLDMYDYLGINNRSNVRSGVTEPVSQLPTSDISTAQLDMYDYLGIDRSDVPRGVPRTMIPPATPPPTPTSLCSETDTDDSTDEDRSKL